MAKIAPAQAQSADPLAIECEALVSAMTEINVDELRANARDLTQKKVDLARAHQKDGSISIEGKQRDPEAYRRAVEQRDQLDADLSSASGKANAAEKRKKKMQDRIDEIDTQMSAKQRSADEKAKCVGIADRIFALHSDRVEKTNSLPQRRHRLAELVELRERELQAAIAKTDGSQADGIGGRLPALDADIEVARGGLAATEAKIASIAGEIAELKAQYESAARAYHGAMCDVVDLEDEAHERLDAPRRIEREVRYFLSNRTVPDRKKPDDDAVTNRLRELGGELPKLPREMFRPIVTASAEVDDGADASAPTAQAAA